MYVAHEKAWETSRQGVDRKTVALLNFVCANTNTTGMTSQSKGRLTAYRQALTAIAARTGTPLPSLILSFGILHEITAVVPLVGIFYGSRALGIGERVVSAIVEDKTQNSTYNGIRTHDESRLSWSKRKLKSWVEEGDRWTIKVGRRYGIFGYEKRIPGTVDDIEEMAGISGHIAGDVANAILAYGATKVRPVEEFLTYQ